jgi:hypothetical protein
MSECIDRPLPSRCLGCAAPLGQGSVEFCPQCGPGLTGQQAAELRRIVLELARLDAARGRLLADRAVILADIRTVRPQSAAGLAPQPVAEPSAASRRPLAESLKYPKPATVPGVGAAGPGRTRHELSRAAAANLLLGAGGLLLVIAVAAFTAVSWGRIGTLGRAGILVPTAIVALAASGPLARRGLTATAESVAGVGLALTAAVAWLARDLAPRGTDGGLAYAAVACTVLAAGWAAYGAASALRGPRLAAIGFAQVPVPLAFGAITHWAPAVALGLVLTAGGDVAIASRRRSGAEHLTAIVSAIVTWSWGVLVAAITAARTPALAGSLTPAAVFAVAAVISVLGARLAGTRNKANLITAAAGVLAAVALGLPAAARLPAGWPTGAFAAGGAAVAAAGWYLARRRLAQAGQPEPGKRHAPGAIAGPGGSDPEGQNLQAWPLAAGGALVLAVTAIMTAPAALAEMGYPLSLLGRTWSGPSLAAPAGFPAATSWHASPAGPGVLAVAAIACWLFPRSRGNRRFRARAAALTVATLAAGSAPVAAGLPGWAALAIVTTAAATLLGTGTVVADQVLAETATLDGIVLAVLAALWSLASPAATITELAVLAVIVTAAAAAARPLLPEIATAAGAMAALAGLALAASLAAGLPPGNTAFAVVATAAAAAGAATLLRRARPLQALVLDLSAGLAVVLAAAMAAQRADTFCVLATAVAALASATAWTRDGQRRVATAAAAAAAAAAAIGSEGGHLLLAASLPYRSLIRPWHGSQGASPGEPGWTAAHVAGLPLAFTVLAACAAMAVAASGAWRGSRGSLDALAIALPVIAAPAGAAAGLGYGAMTAIMLTLTLVLTWWTAAGRSLAPAAAALASAQLTIAWAAAATTPTLLVLGCLASAYAACAWLARPPAVRASAAALTVICAAALAGCAALAAGLPAWQAGLAVTGAAVLAQPAAARLARHRPLQSLAVETTGWLAAAAGCAPSLTTPWHSCIALAVIGTACLGVALRPDRRPWLWAGLALWQAAWCLWLASLAVSAPEPYAVPAAAIVTASGRFCWRGRESSWVTYGPGLAVLLLPSLAASLPDHGWIRPLLLAAAAVAITAAGARARLQAPVAIGAAVTIADAGHELATALSHLGGLVPGWVPIAVSGAVLFSIGATYEARLRNLRALRKAFASMR